MKRIILFLLVCIIALGIVFGVCIICRHSKDNLLIVGISNEVTFNIDNKDKQHSDDSEDSENANGIDGVVFQTFLNVLLTIFFKWLIAKVKLKLEKIMKTFQSLKNNKGKTRRKQYREKAALQQIRVGMLKDGKTNLLVEDLWKTSISKKALWVFYRSAFCVVQYHVFSNDKNYCCSRLSLYLFYL